MDMRPASNEQSTCMSLCLTCDICRPGEDFRFTLMRHWTLYDAMLHSSYVAVRMHTYTDKGQRSLNDLLAKMGFRIKDCQHDYCAPGLSTSPA